MESIKCVVLYACRFSALMSFYTALLIASSMKIYTHYVDSQQQQFPFVQKEVLNLVFDIMATHRGIDKIWSRTGGTLSVEENPMCELYHVSWWLYLGSTH